MVDKVGFAMNTEHYIRSWGAAQLLCIMYGTLSSNNFLKILKNEEHHLVVRTPHVLNGRSFNVLFSTSRECYCSCTVQYHNL